MMILGCRRLLEAGMATNALNLRLGASGVVLLHGDMAVDVLTALRWNEAYF